MDTNKLARGVVIASVLSGLVLASGAQAGMPAPLPSDWTQDSTPSWAPHDSARSSMIGHYLQGFSFFVASLFLCAWAVKGLWHVLRRDLTWLPSLSYGRSLSLVILWGFLFVVVLTMISGARELMTPGAWQKKGWTYELAEPPPVQRDSMAENADK
jgi:hypothetical protein